MEPVTQVTLKALASVSHDEFAAILSGPPAAAAAWVAAAAQNGIVEAQAVYGQYLLDGHGVERNVDEALTWFRHAARRDHPMAMNMLGRCYEHGWGTAQCRAGRCVLVPACGASGARLGHVQLCVGARAR